MKNGHVLDPGNRIDERMDVGIEGNTIKDVERTLAATQYDRTIDATGMLVLPGLIDLHTHVAEHLTPGLGINADRYCLSRGVTTAVDAGSAGELTFNAFRELIIKNAATRILSFLNAESLGMIEYDPEETGQKWANLYTSDGESYYDFFVNSENSIKILSENPDLIVGLKWAHHGEGSLRKAIDLARKADTRIMVENHFMPETAGYLKKGDVITHIFHGTFNSNSGSIDGILDPEGNVHEELFRAKREGIYLDLGHGRASFSWKVAEIAMNASLLPNVISSDLWKSNVHGPVFDLPTTMSKMLHLGMKLEDVVLAVTRTPATILGKEKELGTIKPGAIADLLIAKISEQKVLLVDSMGEAREARRLVLPRTVISGGGVFINHN